MMRADWHYPTRVRFGAGRVAELSEACRELGIHRPLVVTDPGLAAGGPGEAVSARVHEVLHDAGLFSGVRSNPVGTDVQAGVAAYRHGGHDGVVALGGGSALDVGKAIALMVGQKRPIWDFEDVGDNWTRADESGIAPTVAVPTTAGTGSEVGRSAVITRHHEKKIIFHPRMMPAQVICDPELTVSLPPQLTAGTGMDALSHLIEAWCAPGFHPQADGIAVEGMRLVHRYLERAVGDGTDLEARAGMMAAALMGATAFQKGLGAMHALSHPLGARFDTHHGTTNAVVMPYVLVYNRPAIEERIERAARYLRLPGTFDAFLNSILALRAAVGIPHTLADLQIPTDMVDALAVAAARDPTAATNARPLDAEILARLYRAAITGDLDAAAG